MDMQAIIQWLREDDPARLTDLWAQADAVRKQLVGDAIHLRGLIEISSYCRRCCAYCGIRAARKDLQRYRMTAEEILDTAALAAKLNYGTVVIQGGEDPGIEASWLAEIIKRIKAMGIAAVTLSLGQRDAEELAMWRDAGADRYLMRFETSDAGLFAKLHPAVGHGDTLEDRLAVLRQLRDLGYEIGSGVLVGIPGQSYDMLARDLLLFKRMDLDMIGLGPWVCDPNTPLADRGRFADINAGQQVPASVEMACKVVAISRLLCPEANIPATTALATLEGNAGRQHGLCRGANVLMPNLTPARYRRLYAIYPDKAGSDQDAVESDRALRNVVTALGRTIADGPGNRCHGE